ncbi:hypothetical protein D3C75_630490 [compost metagenome]
MNGNVLEVIQHKQVRLVSRSNSPYITQSEAFGCIQGYHLNGCNGVQPAPDRQSDNMVDASFLQQIVQMLIVGYEQTSPGIPGGDGRQ